MSIRGLIERAQRHPYYHLVDSSGELYMMRYWLFGQGTDRDRDDRFPGAPYINKPRGRFAHWLASHVCVRVHQVLKSDSDRHLHDHPAWNFTVVLTGGFYEVMPCKDGTKYPFHDVLANPSRNGIREADLYVGEASRVKWRGPGSLVFRRARSRHKIVLPRKAPRTFTLFVIGKKSNDWGFYRAGCKIGWREYLAEKSPPRVVR